VFEGEKRGLQPKLKSSRKWRKPAWLLDLSRFRKCVRKKHLSNEKYIGDTLAQKKMSADVFPFQKVPNKGEKDQYYIIWTILRVLF
jgi:hypothetical protein